MDPDDVSRLSKMAMDDGTAASRAEADSYFRGFRLQIVVGSGRASAELHAAILTAVNTGARAFPGGVGVLIQADGPCEAPWGTGRMLSDAVRSFGATRISGAAELAASDPTIVFASTARYSGSPVLHPTAWGWCAAVAPGPSTDNELEAPPNALSAILAGALAVSEAFQSRRGDVIAGRREIGLSLWRPDLDVSLVDAVGPRLALLPAEAWLIGLGHLGQAYAWCLGLLPYGDRGAVRLALQDVDSLRRANLATSLLARDSDAAQRRPKTRLVADRLEALGFRTRIIERLLTSGQRVEPGEPGLALAGLDSPEPRRLLDRCGFTRVVDAGLGAGSTGYLTINLERLGDRRPADEIFVGPDVDPAACDVGMLGLPAYRNLASEMDSCGVLRVARSTVATSFVGAVAATLALADPLRALHGGLDIESVAMSLRDPSDVRLAGVGSADPCKLPLYVPVAGSLGA